MKSQEIGTDVATQSGDPKQESREPASQPGGLFPVGKINGGPIEVQFVSAAGEVFAHDVVHPTWDGAVASAGEPGKTLYCGVAFTPSLGNSRSRVCVIRAAGTIFAARGFGDPELFERVVRRAPAFANLRFDAGNRITWQSGHKVDFQTAANDSHLDIRAFRTLSEESISSVEVIFNRIQPLQGADRKKGASRRLIQTKEAFDRAMRIVISQISARGKEIGSLSEEDAAGELSTILNQPNLDARQLRRLKSYYYGDCSWNEVRIRFRPIPPRSTREDS